MSDVGLQQHKQAGAMDGSFSKRVKHREDGKLVPDQELIHVWKGGTLNHCGRCFCY